MSFCLKSDIYERLQAQIIACFFLFFGTKIILLWAELYHIIIALMESDDNGIILEGDTR